MNFSFSDEQLEFRDTVEAMLQKEVTPERIRERWDTDSGADLAFEAKIAEMGIPIMLVPEDQGGLGLGPVDLVLIAEAAGRVALPEPVVNDALVVAPMLAELARDDARCEQLLPQLLAGEIRVGVAHQINPFINFGADRDWFILPQGEEVHLLARDEVSITPAGSVDPSRRLARVDWNPATRSRVASGNYGAKLWRATLNRGALGAAAQLAGLAQGMIERAVAYSMDREQFGKPIGSFQAVKHLMADCATKLEFARPPLYRSAYTVGVAPERADYALSHAKVACGEAALLAARNAMQVHGAMGYTWECDLQIWMKHAWALDKAWGDAGFHKNRVHQWLRQDSALTGPEHSFGRQSQEASYA
jgi:alkylation response protein AidB-like acyl-CoA dehydrogenase